MNVTDTWLKANHKKPIDKVKEIADRDGMSLRISQKGKITFQLRYRFNSKRERLDLGTYPLMTLKQARDAAFTYRSLIEQNICPKQHRLKQKLASETAHTLESMIRTWHGKHRAGQVASATQILRAFEIHFFPKYGKYAAETFTKLEWLNALEPIAKKRPAVATQLMINSRMACRWAERMQIITHNPLNDVTSRADLKVVRRNVKRSLSDREIIYFWEALQESRITTKNAIYLKLILLFGARKGELRQAEMHEFDRENNIWTIPPEKHKTGDTSEDPIIRPVIQEAWDLIDAAQSLSRSKTFLFSKSGSDQPMGETGDLTIPYNIRQWLRRHRGYEMEHWSLHDLRRTARTNWSALTAPHVAEVMLGHSLGAMNQVYDRYLYLEEQKAAYEAWAKRLKSLLGVETLL